MSLYYEGKPIRAKDLYKERDALIRKRLSEGMTISLVAKRLGVSYDIVKNVAAKTKNFEPQSE